MPFQNVIRRIIYLLAEAEWNAALQQRQRGNVSDSSRIGDRSAARHTTTDLGHARTKFPSTSERRSTQSHRRQPE